MCKLSRLRKKTQELNGVKLITKYSSKMDVVYICLLISMLFTSSSGERANPLKDPHICGRPQCESDNTKFNYTSNIRYVYDYSSHIRSEFNGTGQNSSDIYVSATVTLTFPKKCEGTMRVTDVELREHIFDAESGDEESGDGYGSINDLHSKSDEFKADVQKYDLRFSYHDGIIGELCPQPDEPNWVMNFKRGILSSFQNTMKRFDIDFKSTETDISGTCDVNYVIKGAQNTSFIVEKHKDISSCINRYKTNSIFQTTPYDFRKQYSVLPVLQSTSHCNITLDHNIYQGVSCHERHQFAPFSNNGAGAVTSTTISLTLLDEELLEVEEPVSYSNEEDSIKKREKLLFNHYPTPKHTTGEINNARVLLQRMCKLGFPDIKREFIDVYSKFLQNARLLSTKALHQLFSRASSICNDNDNGKNHILESLPYIGSTASVEMMAQEIIKKSISDEVAHKWLTSLSFLPRPDEQMLHALYMVLENEVNNLEPIFILGPTSVVHTFCRNHGECGENSVVKDFIGFLETNILETLQKDLSVRRNREKSVVLLRGIGNIGLMSKAFRYKMREYIENDAIPVEVRLNVIAAHRRTDCEKNRDYFIDTYRNMTANSELRIAAYLETMRCPDYLTVKQIKYILETEEVNQVGSFVWSHLRNIAKSASPVRVPAQALLVDDELGKKYRLDFRKFSHNFENSLFFDEYNIGVNSDANLIFGTDSYMPRAATYNFTVDLFGESVNIFEVSAYMQGFEHMVEGIFGPKGPLSSEGFSDNVESVKDYFKHKLAPIRDKINLRLRRDAQEKTQSSENNAAEEYDLENEDSDKPKEKRDAQNQADKLQNDVKELNYDIKYNMNKPRAGFGLKMFGNDVNYKTIEDLHEVYALFQKLNPMNQLKQLLSGKEIIYTKSGVFLEVSYEVPLASGFPLALHAYGASSIDLRASGSLNGDSFWQDPKFTIKGKLKPSVSLDVIGTMQSDYFYGISGIRVKSNLYSSSSVEANLKVDGKNYVSLQFGLPQDRSDIISARSEMIVLQNEHEIRQPGIEKRYTNSSCTWPGVERAIGLKVCSDYSLPDISKSEKQLPSLLLCGPVKIEVHIDKDDLSAKTFSLEYKWVDLPGHSSGNLIFETPNSEIPRKFTANITKQPDTYSLVMKFQNGKTIHSATASYKNTNDEKLVDAHLLIDSKKSFALEMGMNRSSIVHGWIYYPRFSLAVNNDQIAGLSGTVKRFGKNKIIQYDPNLEFETKRFKARMTGYITTTDNKFTTRLLVNYKFTESKEELIDFESELESLHDGYRTSLVGMAKWNSTAYQKYNFKANIDYKRVLGHIELGLNINNAIDFVDPKYDLGIRLTFIKTDTEDKEFNSRTSFAIEVTRPISKINYKFMIKYNSKLKRGPLHNILLLFRYAEGKEATVVVSAMLPTAYTHNIDFYINISIPGFNSCTARFQAIERTKRLQYDINIQGTWFTGHSITIYGTYDDKSLTQESRHQLKLVLKSPHFNETTILAKYLMNEQEMKIEINVDYGSYPYGIIIGHNHVSFYEQSFYGELKVLEKRYWISARLSDEHFRKLSVDLHLDRAREIRIIIGGQSTPLKKEIEAKISWDSNRDPTQELFLNADFNTPKYKTYDGGFTISYPARTFSGSFDLAIPGPTYRGNLSIGWRSNETIHISMDSGAIYEPKRHFWTDLRLKTPFTGWKTNMFQAQLYQVKNLLSSNVTVLWAETQQLVLGAMTDFEFDNPQIKCEAKILVNSTVKDVPTINAFVKHIQDVRHYITDISIHHAPHNEKPNIFAVKSNWQLNSNEQFSNITGSMNMQTPLKGYSKGALATKFSLSTSRALRGAADFELEERKFTLAVDGSVKKLTDCMLTVNITTPIERYRNIISRFGLINRKRHIVAEVRAPAGALGVEIKFEVESKSNFDVILNLETPIESFKKIMLIGKLRPEMIDFRGGLNKFVLGYVGVSRKMSLDDFEFSWKVYTPLDHFEESSLVVKFIRKQIFDMEVMLKFAQKKLGIIVNGKPKRRLIDLPRVEHYLPFSSKLSDDFDRFTKYFVTQPGSDEDDEEEIDDENNSESGEWSISGHMELNTIIWPTISGFVDVDDIDEEYYIIRSNLNLPAGNIVLHDHLYFPDLMNIRNSLQVSTPYETFKEIEMLFLYSVNFGHYYVFATEFFYKNNTNWVELGYNANYTKVKDVDLKTHDVELNLFLPFETMPRVMLSGSAEIGESNYKAKISGRTLHTFMSLAADLETDTNFFDIEIGLALSAIKLPHYELKVYFKQDLADAENSLVFGFDEDYNHDRTFCRLESNWHTEANYIKFSSKASTNAFPITRIETSIILNRSVNSVAVIDLKIQSLSKRPLSFHASAKRRGERVEIELATPMQSLANVTMSVLVRRNAQENQYLVTGKLTRNREFYNVNGTVEINANIPTSVDLILRPVSRDSVTYFSYSLKANNNDPQKKVYLRISNEIAFLEMNTAMTVFSKLNWNTATTIDASPSLLSRKRDGNHCTFKTSLKPNNDGKLFGELVLLTPWRQYGIDAFSVNGSAHMKPTSGFVNLFYDFSLGHGRVLSSWTFELLENMQALFDFKSESEMGIRTLNVGIRYANPGKTNQRLTYGGNLDVDSKVNLETNCSLSIASLSETSGNFAIRLPAPIDDIHRFGGRYRCHGDILAMNCDDFIVETKHESERERKRFVSRGQYRNLTDLQTLLHAQWGTDTVNKTFETNLQMLRKGIRREVSARVKTPYYTEETIQATGFYDNDKIYHIFKASANFPASREIASTHVEFSSVANVRGFVNCTTPFPNVTWIRTDLNYTTQGGSSRRFIKTTWPKDFAFFDMISTFDSQNNDRNNQGNIQMEVPLASRHTASIQYNLKERKTLTTGDCAVIYNDNKVLNGKYTCNIESRAGFLKENTEILADNVYYPVGIAYMHQMDYTKADSPDFDMKRAELYELKDSNRFNITGELHVRTTETGQAYKLIAIHPNRTVVITSDYDLYDTTMNQKLKLQLSTEMWIAYDFKLTNLTTALNDSQEFSVDLQYPKRNLSASGWYSITEDAFDSDLAFKWTKEKTQTGETEDDYGYGFGRSDEESNENVEEKTVTNEEKIINAALTWRNEVLNENDKCNQTLLLVVKHPSFQKDVTFNANYYRSNVDLMHGKLVIDYHNDPEHLLTLEGGIMDSSEQFNHRNYSMRVMGMHDVSNFDLHALGSVAAKSGVYATKNFGWYKRGYLPKLEGLLNAGVDIPNNDIHYHKETPHKTYYVWVRADGEYPIYTLNGTYEDSPEINTTAAFFINIDDRLVKLDANFTPDASQNLRMLGIIPDARSASFDLWRDYEDIRIVDVAYYLRMNHSRLITSQLIWRPKLKIELKDGFTKISSQMYDSFSENMDFWVKTLYSEVNETMNDIWSNARPTADEFLEDISGLGVIGEDIEDFRKLLNQSYEANDFYIKTMVNFTLTVLDELAIRNHIGSVPKILKEIWQVLGDSGIALRKSILWLIETIKTTYKNTIDTLNRIFHGEAMTYVSAIVEKAIYKYDRFIKDLHLSFIKYVQNIFNNISNTVMSYWRGMLERIQPMFMRFIHYAESLLWSISQEIFEFLHKHTNDLVQSPYFDTVSDFMRDFDAVYRDIQDNDAITNIKKYSSLLSAFLREKYFKVVPFGRELQKLLNELVEEIQQLKKQEQVQFIINRIDEWEQKFTWFAEEFQLDKRMHQLWMIILNKITSYEQTALQMDDKYREAKTKFIFDPNAGVMKLEQKLPMAWHAFNETPIFEEISEFQTLTKVFRIFNGVNVSFVPFDMWQYYTNPYLWLPPFKARSLLVGSRHFITFDKRFVSLNHKYGFIENSQKPDQCSYLLANDFIDYNFTLAQEPSTALHKDKLLSTRKLSILADGHIIDIDLVSGTVKIDQSSMTALPIQIGDTIIYREWDILVIQSKNGYELNCNLQFDFCSFEISGWYFGKTAGIMGTVNNEIYDEFLTSDHMITKDINEFTWSWALKKNEQNDQCKQDVITEQSLPISNELLNICDTYFRSKVSPFANCFPTVDSLPFYDMCLDMGSNSITDFTHNDHPAQKGACAVAFAYMESCTEQNLPLRVPEICLHCNLINGSYVSEGSIFDMKDQEVPKTTDVVFIVEATSCNHNLPVNKNMPSILAALEKSFGEVGLSDTRYAVVAFGGPAPFENAQSIVYNNKIFTDSHNIRHHFDHIKTSNTNSSDISRAIKIASELVFRPGASKTFILMPCSNCNVSGMHFDYSTVLQFLFEHNINLHIFMNGNFEAKKPRNENKIFGFDSGHAYTNSYLKEDIGNKELRSEIILPKNTLGFCMVWALETNGTIFNANKLKTNSRTPIKKFAGVFAKRVANSAIPSPCQTCECTGENNGIAYMTCTRCDFPNEFEEEDVNSIFDEDLMGEDEESINDE